MKSFGLFVLLPLALACTNPDTNSCASFIKSQSATASAFCATFTTKAVTATTGLPSWATNCSNKPSQISKECSCYYTAGSGGSGGSATTTAGSGSGGSAPTGVTTKLPSSSGVASYSTAVVVASAATYDGGMKRFERSPVVCEEQTETGEEDAMFILEAGATLKNVIIGASQAEGVHCRGTCTLQNVWWADVCEDAATFKQTSGTSYVIGGGAFKAADKIFQFNGRGTVDIKYFYANDYGKLARSCGNCSNNGGPRNFIISDTIAVDGGVLCGINTNFGDTCTITNCCQDDGKFCDLYKGVQSGSEPTKLSSGPDGTYCKASSTSTNC